MPTPLAVCTKEEQRAVIRFLWSKGVPGAEINRRLATQYGDSALARYTGFIPGLKYSFGKTYGHSESRIEVKQQQEFWSERENGYQAECKEKIQQLKSCKENTSQENADRDSVEKPCCINVSRHQDCVPPARRVQWTDHEAKHVDVCPPSVQEVEPTGIYNVRNAATQCNGKVIRMSETEEEEEQQRHSAATQWSDQEAHRRAMYSAATQWSTMDFSPAKTIPGYTGHLPGRHYVNPGQTFRQEMDAVLANFHLQPTNVTPKSRHTFPAHHQNHYQNDGKGGDEDPYFDHRPPSTYTKGNNPIPGYQGFVPRVRTSASALGVRYMKAVEKSLEKSHQKDIPKDHSSNPEHNSNAPNKLLDQRPLHTPRHRPHPHRNLDGEEDWREVYRRPPSTYQNNSRTYIPGYKGFVPHLRGSPNAVGIRYSKAALRCLEVSQSEQPGRPKTDATVTGNRYVSDEETHGEMSGPRPVGNAHYNDEEFCQDDADEGDDTEEEVPYDDEEPNQENSFVQDDSVQQRSNRHQTQPVDIRPYRQDHSHYLEDRRPSTYKTDERHPIPGYQGFIPRMKDSPSTLGLRYTKAAMKTLDDIHKMQRR